MGQEISFLFYFGRDQQLSVGMFTSSSIWSPSLGMVMCHQDTRTALPAVPSVLAGWVQLPVKQHLQR